MDRIPTPCHVLLVEDNPGDARLFELAANELRSNLKIVTAPGAAAALDFLFRRGKFSDAPACALVIVDLHLWNGSGFEVLRAVKTDALLRVVPVIIMSASLNPRDVRRSYAEGANAYVGKPGDLDGLFACIRSVVRYWFGLVTLPDPELPDAVC